MKLVLTLVLVCAIAYGVESVRYYNWGITTNNVMCTRLIELKSQSNRIVSANFTCTSVSIRHTLLCEFIIHFIVSLLIYCFSPHAESVERHCHRCLYC